MPYHIRLNMIVKNEASVIERCLSSVKPYIHSWVIVDTGSTDGTQQLIENFMQDVPGHLYQKPWKNFGHNRTEALQLAKQAALEPADYLLFIDADETLIAADGFEWANLGHTAYHFQCIFDHLRYHRNALVSTQLDWQWVGVLHEYLQATQTHTWQLLEGLSIFVQHDSARGKNPQTYLNDIKTLQQGLMDEPQNSRYQFYLAQSYFDAGMLPEALKEYEKRAHMAGWEEERWMAQFKAAQIKERLNYSFECVFVAYFETWRARPQRAEPAYELARFCRLQNKFDLASHFAKIACETQKPSDILFIDASVYAWRALDELSVSATYAINYKSDGQIAINQLISEQRFPESERERILSNQKFYLT